LRLKDETEMTQITNEIVRIMELRRLGKATSTDIERLETLKAEFGRSFAPDKNVNGK